MSSTQPQMQAQGQATTGVAQPNATKSPDEMAEALAQSKNWSSVQLLSISLDLLLQMIG